MKHVFIMKDTKRNHDFEAIINDVMKDYDYDVIYTHYLKEVNERVSEYKEKARFYSVGGDGSISGVMQSLVNTEHEFTPIPMGTGNDFIRQLTNERKPENILRNSLNAPVVKVDCIQMNDRYYINTACFGVDSVIANHIHDVEDNPLVPRSQSYLAGILKHVAGYEFGEIELYSEGELLYQGQIIVAVLNNGRYYGGGFEITPQADMQDGYMDIVICDKVKMTKVPKLIMNILNRTHLTRKEVSVFKVKEAYLKTMNVGNLDGDEIEVVGEYHFKVIPSSINLVMYK